jgi:hypothetical protein
MCDYSLMAVPNRLAREGENLVVHRFPTSSLLIIRLLQQAPTGSVEGCRDRRSRRRFASFKPISPRRKPASTTWRPVDGQMGSSVLAAVMSEPMNW